ncbi:MAG: UvsX-like recombinase [phage Lak_Megaphage_RVC_AP4_GC26]|uniref:UvsX-like recombinase n=1 Tax=phage Lak_Megaphage_RVC_AP3_GC26 TaxID=3109225 RepID=A0ABZ0Z3P0_9CAUD|nr:MAG: UvsX-like recombinase [phage Lak_Megaphage_RVC_AP3_GC26]WQJ52663.1 MAG: UvsX-like recombinase [phage Lak_Megaphage_RVC_AP4_GC26]
MVKKKQSSEDFEGGIGSLMSMVSSIDDQAEIIADSAYSNIKEWISTGNYILNACMSGDIYKAIPTGRVVTFSGTSGAGKSFLACSCCREAQKLGYIPIYLDSEGAIDSDFVKRLGVDPTKMIIKKVNTIMETSQFIANLCDKLQEQQDKFGQHDKVIIVLDSLGNLTSEKEREDTLSGSQKADFTKAKDTKAMFRVCATPIAKLQIPWIVVNHVYQSMSFIPQNIQAMGSGIVYNASITIELSAAKLEDKENDTAAKSRQGSDAGTKNGVLVTAKPVKSRFCRPIKIKFQIPYFKKPNPFVGLEQFMTWENSGVCRGNLLTQKEYDKLSDGDKKKVYTWTTDAGETFYCLPKDTARYIVVKHLNAQVPFTDFWSNKVFTPEYLDYINENVIHPMFQLPDQSAFDDVKDLEETMGISDESKEDDPIAEANID